MTLILKLNKIKNNNMKEIILYFLFRVTFAVNIKYINI